MLLGLDGMLQVELEKILWEPAGSCLGDIILTWVRERKEINCRNRFEQVLKYDYSKYIVGRLNN